MRTYKRKTKRGTIPHETYKEAADDVLENGFSVPQAAKKHDVQYMTLLRYVKKLKQFREQDSGYEPKTGYIQGRKIFTDDQEMQLFNYLQDHSDAFFGFCIKDLRLLAYDFAIDKDIPIPKTWEANSEAGRDWVLSFKERNPKLRVRIQDATTIPTTQTFKKKSIIDPFYDQLEKLYNQCNFAAQDIYNVDEIEVTTLPKFKDAAEATKKYLEIKTTKEIPLVTICFAVNAIGKVVPPMFVFPRETFLNNYLTDGPHDSIGCANPLGLMTRYDFLTYIKHFCNYTGATIKHPVLLVLDNHESHISVDIFNFCKINGIYLLSFPTNCSCKLQPIERSVIKPFQRRYTKMLDKWLESNPGKSATITDVPRMVNEILLMTLTRNVRSGFEITGIWPLNRNVLTDEDITPEQIKKEIKKQNKLKQSSMALRPFKMEKVIPGQYLPSFITLSSNKSEEPIEVIELQPGTLKESDRVVVLELTVQLENLADPMNVSSLPKDGSSLPKDSSSLPMDGTSIPVDDNDLPKDSGVSLPVDRSSIPVDGNFLSMDGNSFPVDNNSVPVDGSALSKDGSSIPACGSSIPVDGSSLLKNGSSLPLNDSSLRVDGSSHSQEMETIAEISAEIAIAQEKQPQIKKSQMRNVEKTALPKDGSSHSTNGCFFTEESNYVFVNSSYVSEDNSFFCEFEDKSQPLVILTKGDKRKLLREMETLTEIPAETAVSQEEKSRMRKIEKTALSKDHSYLPEDGSSVSKDVNSFPVYVNSLPIENSSFIKDGNSLSVDGKSLPIDDSSHLSEMETLIQIAKTVITQEQSQIKKSLMRNIEKTALPKDGNSLSINGCSFAEESNCVFENSNYVPEDGSSVPKDVNSLPVHINYLPIEVSSFTNDNSLPGNGSSHLQKIETLTEIPAEMAIIQEEQSQVKKSRIKNVGKTAVSEDSSYIPEDDNSLCESEIELLPLVFLMEKRKKKHLQEMDVLTEIPDKSVIVQEEQSRMKKCRIKKFEKIVFPKDAFLSEDSSCLPQNGSFPLVNDTSFPVHGNSYLQQMGILAKISTETTVTQAEQSQVKKSRMKNVKQTAVPNDGSFLPVNDNFVNGSFLSLDGSSLSVYGNSHLQKMQTYTETPVKMTIIQEEQSQVKESGIKNGEKTAVSRNDSSFPEDSNTLRVDGNFLSMDDNFLSVDESSVIVNSSSYLLKMETSTEISAAVAQEEQSQVEKSGMKNIKKTAVSKDNSSLPMNGSSYLQEMETLKEISVETDIAQEEQLQVKKSRKKRRAVTLLKDSCSFCEFELQSSIVTRGRKRKLLQEIEPSQVREFRMRKTKENTQKIKKFKAPEDFLLVFTVLSNPDKEE